MIFVTTRIVRLVRRAIRALPPVLAITIVAATAVGAVTIARLFATAITATAVAIVTSIVRLAIAVAAVTAAIPAAISVACVAATIIVAVAIETSGALIVTRAGVAVGTTRSVIAPVILGFAAIIIVALRVAAAGIAFVGHHVLLLQTPAHGLSAASQVYG